MTRHRKSRFEAHQLGCREGAPRPSDESSPPPRAGHLSGTGHLLPMRRGAGDAAGAHVLARVLAQCDGAEDGMRLGCYFGGGGGVLLAAF